MTQSILNAQDLITKLQALKPAIEKRYKARPVGLFGSYVRGEQRETSDVDILVDFQDDADLFDFVGLGFFLEEELHIKVDVVPRKALRAEIREVVLREMVIL